MSRIFLSHSSANNTEAIAVRDWMVRQGWEDVFLDLDPDRGLKAGQRWQDALKQAAERCELVIFLVSPAWASSKWCLAEFLLAKNLNKRIFAAIVQPTPFDAMPIEMTAEWQVVDLTAGARDYKITVTLPPGNETALVAFGSDGLNRLRTGLMEAGLDARYFAWPPENDPDRSPYPGLRALEAEDAGIFFGREAPTILALDRLRGLRGAAPPRLLVIQGASGAGKSSFLRAGLIPRLERDDAHFLPLPMVRPEMAVISGPTGLTQAIEAAFKAQRRPVNRAEIAASIDGGASQLLSLLARLADRGRGPELYGKTELPAQPSLVLSVDQAEELFHAEGAEEARHFLALLKDLALASTPNLIILFTIRSDSYERLQTAKELDGVRQETFPLPPMPRGAFQTIIEGPVQRLQQGGKRTLKIDPALTAQLLTDIEEGGGKDALPLLAFTLERLYRDYGAQGNLLLDEYKVKLRGIEGSIQAAVDAALKAANADPTIPKDPLERMALLRRAMIPALASIDPETRISRRRVARLSDIPQEAHALIDCLVKARLLVTDEIKEAGKSEITVEPAHEALLRQWSALQGWLKDETADLLTLGGVQQAARDWTAKGRPSNWLVHTAGRLEDAERLRERPDFARFITPVEQAYLGACRAQENQRRDRELEEAKKLAEAQKRVAQRTRIGLLVASILLVFAAGSAWYAFGEKAVADTNAAEARTQTQIAKANAAEAGRQKASAEKQAAEQQAEKFAAQSKVNLDLHAPHNILLALESISIDRDVGAFSPTVSSQRLIDVLSEAGGVPLDHTDKVVAVEFSPDDHWVATASGDAIRLWDSKNSTSKPRLLHANAPVTRLAFSPDGGTLASVGSGSNVSLWDTNAPDAPVRSLPTAKGEWHDLGFSKDGRWLAAASSDGRRAQLWLLSPTNAPPATWVLPHGKSVNTLAFSPDSKWLATGSEDGIVRLWNLSVSSPSEGVKTLSTGMDVRKVAFSPDGHWLAAGETESYTVHLWRTDTLDNPFKLHVNQWGLALAFSPDSHWLATPSQYDARLWDLEKPDPSLDPVVLPGHSNAISDLAFSPDGGWFATSSSDHTIRLWNTLERTAPPTVLRGHQERVSRLVFSHDGRRLASAGDDRVVRLWNVASPSALPLIVRSSPGPDRLNSSPGPTKLKSYTLKADELTSTPRELTDQQYPFASGTVVSPDGNWIAQIPRGDDTDHVDLISTSGSAHYVLKHPGRIWAAPVFSPDSRWLAIGGVADPSIRLWDLKAPDPAASPVILRGHRAPIRSLAFGADRHRFVSGARDGTAILWDLTDDGTAASQTTLPGGDVSSVAISADSRYVVTGSWEPDYDARIWDLTSPTAPGKPVRLAFKDRMSEVAFSPDARWVAAGSWDTTIQLLDLTRADSKPFILGGHTARTLSVAFSPHNHWLATGNEDRTVRLWNLDGEDPSSSSIVLGATYTYGVSLAFSPDGRWLAMSPSVYRSNPFTPDSQSLVTSSPETHLYPMRLEDLVSLACRTSGRAALVGDADQSLYSKHCPPTRIANDEQ
jgi:WD40 repeat protein